MPIAFVDYGPEHSTAVRECNQRLAAGGVAEGFLLPPEPLDPAAIVRRHIRPRWRLALDGEITAGGAVRGGYLLKTQRFLAAGTPVEAGGYQAPISEGVVNRKFAIVGVQLLQDALAQNPYLFTTGMGGIDRPVAKLLQARGFRLNLAPFLFRIHHSGRFFRQLSALRTTPARRAAADLLALTGLGWLASAAIHWRRFLHPRTSVQVENTFGDWAGEIWEQTNNRFSLIAERTPAALAELYPPAAHCRIVRVPGAWAVTWISQMQGSPHFGNLRVGTVLDCLAGPNETESIARAAAAALEEQGADLIITNQTADFIVDGFRRAGFRAGPSNYGLGLSPALNKLASSGAGPWHMTRGDGDGRVNL